MTEFRSLKFSHNKQFADCIRAIIPPLFSETLKGAPEATGGALVKILKELIAKWSKVIKEFLYTSVEKKCLITTIEQTCAEQERLQKTIHLVLQCCFMSEILDKETIIDWAESEPTEVEPEIREKFDALCKDFIEHLKDESDSSDEDESSEGDDSSSEGSDDN